MSPLLLAALLYAALLLGFCLGVFVVGAGRSDLDAEEFERLCEQRRAER